MTSIVKLDTRVLDKLIKTIEGEVDTFVIEDGVEYGVHQEFTEAGHPSLVPAFERHTRDLPEIVGQVIKNAPNKGLGVINLNKALAKIAFDVAASWAADVNVDTGAYRNSIHVRRE